MESKQFFIITGLSGAGKTQALKILGDFGFYCVDNLPFALLKDFIKYVNSNPNLTKIALGIDIREGSNLPILPNALDKIKASGFNTKLIFLEASTSVLLRRFSETKHRHPLEDDLATAIRQEKQFIKPLKIAADEIINTSSTTLGDLKEEIGKFLKVKRTREMLISVISFGYKNGIPLESDLVMDVRFLKNPYYVASLREKTGLDKDVQDYILKSPHTKTFIKKFTEMLIYLLPKYIREGKSYLTISVGCSGGKHRSVFMAHHLALALQKLGFNCTETHRDIDIVKKEVW
ncbi:MAG: RNase adapter RapZ [Elusimicrobiaceae bacterium]|nr:RNase adapter RapZ [Elusimicrobiaceae bacterium]